MKKLLMALVVILCAVSTVFAAEDLSTKLDKNKDGKVSKKEYTSAVSKTFDKLDKNRDGSITRDELGHMDKKDQETFIKENDADGDGIIIKKNLNRPPKKDSGNWIRTGTVLSAKMNGPVDVPKCIRRLRFSHFNDPGCPE